MTTAVYLNFKAPKELVLGPIFSHVWVDHRRSVYEYICIAHIMYMSSSLLTMNTSNGRLCGEQQTFHCSIMKTCSVTIFLQTVLFKTSQGMFRWSLKMPECSFNVYDTCLELMTEMRKYILILENWTKNIFDPYERKLSTIQYRTNQTRVTSFCIQ